MLPNADAYLELSFPQLAVTGYRITSPQNAFYNCIAWAAGVQHQFWWPEYSYWPNGVPREVNISAFIQAYSTLGYEVCEDDSYDEAFEKIVIYTQPDGIPTHAARQIDEITWTSKLGKNYDISHRIFGLNSDTYGQPNTFMRRLKAQNVDA